MTSHKLLKRQISKFLSEDKVSELKPFLSAIESSYLDMDRNHELLERSMELSSQELFEANAELQLRSAEIETLYKILTISNEDVAIEQIFRSILVEIHQFAKFPKITLELFKEADSTLSLVGHFGISTEALSRHPQKIDAKLTPSGQALFAATGSFETKDISNYKATESLWSALKVKSFIGKTIYSHSKKPIAVLSLAHTESKQSSPRFHSWLEAIGARIAAVIEKKNMSEIMRDQEANMISASRMSELGKMAGGIAHEINTPLATIMLLTQQLGEMVQQPDVDRELVHELTEVISTTTHRIAKIISGLRTFSRDGSDDPMQRADLKNLVANTISFCQEKFRLNGVSLTTSIPEGIEISCRETQLSQVILNLLNNSYDAIEGNSEKWIKVEFKEEVDQVLISVIDSGHGINKEIHDKLFNPFFTTKTIGKGTGLGLSISLGIIRAHNGTLTYDAKSTNTRFDIRFPKNICRFSKKAV